MRGTVTVPEKSAYFSWTFVIVHFKEKIDGFRHLTSLKLGWLQISISSIEIPAWEANLQPAEVRLAKYNSPYICIVLNSFQEVTIWLIMLHMPDSSDAI